MTENQKHLCLAQQSHPVGPDSKGVGVVQDCWWSSRRKAASDGQKQTHFCFSPIPEAGRSQTGEDLQEEIICYLAVAIIITMR